MFKTDLGKAPFIYIIYNQPQSFYHEIVPVCNLEHMPLVIIDLLLPINIHYHIKTLQMTLCIYTLNNHVYHLSIVTVVIYE